MTVATPTKAKPVKDIEPLICPFVCVIDTREQAAWSFRGLHADADQKRRPLIVRTENRCIRSGDYSLACCGECPADGLEEYGGLACRRHRERNLELPCLMESLIAIERKSIGDFYGTILADRDRFERELTRLNTSPMRYAEVICEGDWLTEGPPLSREFGDRAVEVQSKKRKAVFRSVVAWKQRFTRVHWERYPSRGMAEQGAFRTLERFWRDACEAKRKSQIEVSAN